MVIDRSSLRITATCGSDYASSALGRGLLEELGEDALAAISQQREFYRYADDHTVRGAALISSDSYIVHQSCHARGAADSPVWMARVEAALSGLGNTEADLCATAVRAFRRLGGFERASLWHADGTRLWLVDEASEDKPDICLRTLRQRFDEQFLFSLQQTGGFTLCPKATALSGPWSTIERHIDALAAGSAIANGYGALAEQYAPHTIAVIPIIVSGNLYGVLIGALSQASCPPDDMLAACRLFGGGVSAKLMSCQDGNAPAVLADAQLLEEPLALIQASGSAARYAQTRTLEGIAPASGGIDELVAALCALHGEDVFATRSLGIEHPEIASKYGWSGGLLILPLTSRGEEYLAWFRPSAPTIDASLPVECRACSIATECVGANMHVYSRPWTFGEMQLARAIRRRHIALRSTAAEIALSNSSGIEPLTGAATRRALTERLARRGTLMNDHLNALIVFDIDRFKSINDALGNDAGDRLLCAVTQRVGSIIRTYDMIARTGGDEFAVLYENVRENEAEMLAKRICDAFERPFFAEGRLLHLSVSAGFATAREDGMHELLRNADVAMFDAKRCGGNQLCAFSPKVRTLMANQLSVEQQLHAALSRGEFGIEVQPIFRCDDRSLWGVEALLRWDHAQFGSIPPADFIKLAEDNGIITSIGTYVVETAAACFDRWRRGAKIANDFRFSINFSSNDLVRQESARDILRILERAGLPASSLCVELTESAILVDPERVSATLAFLRDAGAEIAVDDFGTGYSSLSFLRTLPISIVKVDRSFVGSMLVDNRDLALVRSVVQLAHDLDMRVVAEGVESAEVLERLIGLKCDFGQGFYLGVPQKPLEFEEQFLTPAPKGSG